MSYFDQFPLDAKLLSQFAVRSKRQMRSAQVGAHLRLQQGQSLEFREYVDYTPGTDFRYIDWPASARVGGEDDLIVRSYGAEHQLTIAISIDNRREFDLPVANPKMRIAFWLAQAIAMMGVSRGDEVLLHRLFGQPGSLLKIRGPNAIGLRDYFNVSERSPAGDEFNLEELDRALPTAAIWVIATDFYGPHSMELSYLIAQKQRGYRWVVLVELDSWPFERRMLSTPTRVESLRLAADDRMELMLDDSAAEAVESSIAARRKEFLNVARLAGRDANFSRWTWEPEAPEDVDAWFYRRFTGDPMLMRVFGSHSA